MKTYRIWVITLFPKYFAPLLECGITSQALQGERGPRFEVHFVNPKDFAPHEQKGVDDAPYGGGPGMVMRADVLKRALLEGVVQAGGYKGTDELAVFYTAPAGTIWKASEAKKFASQYWSPQSEKDLVFLCGRYEGVDQRFLDLYVNGIYCLGDYVLTGGELAVMCLLDSALRFVPGVLGNKLSAEHESFQTPLLEGPQYTRPALFDGQEVPAVLLSGHHQKIADYREQSAYEQTQKWRSEDVP